MVQLPDGLQKFPARHSMESGLRPFGLADAIDRKWQNLCSRMLSREAASRKHRIIRTVSPWPAYIFALAELTSYLALHEATQAVAIRQNPVVISILEWEIRVD